MNAIVQSPTEKSKHRIQNLIDGKNPLDVERARKVWLVLMNLASTAMHAEKAAFYVIEQSLLNNMQGVDDFDSIMRTHLNEIKQQLVFIRSVIHGQTN